MNSSVTAVIPTIGAVDPLDVLSTCSAFRSVGFNVRLVVNGASAASLYAARNADFIDSGENPGFGESIARGAVSDRWDWLLICNDDVAVTETAASEIAISLANEVTHDIVYFGTAPERHIPDRRDVFLNISLLGKLRFFSRRVATDDAPGGSYSSFDLVAISARAWVTLDGFDSNIPFTFEDADFARRALRGGFTAARKPIPGITKRHSVSSVRFASVVIPVSAWSAHQYLLKYGSSRVGSDAIVASALLIRLALGGSGRAGWRANVAGVMSGLRAILTKTKPHLPKYDAL